MNKAWIIGKFDGGTGDFNPNPHRHPSYTSAKLEAERLARKMPGSDFVIFEAMSSAYVAPQPTPTVHWRHAKWNDRTGQGTTF